MPKREEAGREESSYSAQPRRGYVLLFGRKQYAAAGTVVCTRCAR